MSLKTNNLWDSLADVFTPQSQSHIAPSNSPCAPSNSPCLENYLCLFPLLQKTYNKFIIQQNNPKIFDFGCGSGYITERLSKLKGKVYACDPSKEMIRSATMLNINTKVRYFLGSIECLRDNAPYNFITSIMVFQFIKNLDEIIPILSESLIPGGILFFAIHNFDYVKEGINKGIKFTQCHDSKYYIKIHNISIPIEIHDSDYYRRILNNNHLSLLQEKTIHGINNIFEHDKYYVGIYQKSN